METLKLPEIPHIVTDEIVNIPSKQFKMFIDYVNQLAECVETQNDIISKLSTRLEHCEKNIAKMADILEELYEA